MANGIIHCLHAMCLAGLVYSSVAQIHAGETPNPGAVPPQATRVEFHRDIAPILRRRCMTCHGAARQEAGLRLDRRETALKGGASGPVIVPGRSDRSLLIERVTAATAPERMPAESNPLSTDEIAALRAWIDSGGDWPKANSSISAESQHWAYVPPKRPQPPNVQPAGWIRQPADAFILARLRGRQLAPSREAAKERLIRRVTFDLTGLPPSLDEIDDFLADETASAYERVVDRLLGSAGYGERWASPWLDAARYADSNGFQRDTPRTTWAYRDWVVRALNADLPFDQFTIEQLAGDLLPDATFDQKVATGFHRSSMTNLENGVDIDEQRVVAVLDRVNTTAAVWLGTTLECAQCHDHKYDPFSQRDYYRLYAVFNSTDIEIKPGMFGYYPKLIGPKLRLYPLLPPDGQAFGRELESTIEQSQADAERLTRELVERQPSWEAAVRSGNKTVPPEIKKIVEIPPEDRNAFQIVKLRGHLVSTSLELTGANNRLKNAQQKLEKLVPTTLVMNQLAQPRESRIFNRGDFLDLGDVVQPGVPAALNPLPAADAMDRLALARWLVDDANPLVARVTVNRVWHEFFGRGLVTTLEDFGTQGEAPTHPELLDWLATEFVRRQWSVKSLHRLIVTSATYRQTAAVDPQLLETDPNNSLYARGPRRRLSAEMIRDHALMLAESLSRKMYGPAVFPKQPPGIWRQVDAESNLWLTSKGEDRYLRGVYVYWKRTSPYPSFVNFDAPSREVCVLGRGESTTPLQALTLLNDPVYVEAAAGFAARLLEEVPAAASISLRADHGFRLATGRHPTDAESRILAELVADLLQIYRTDSRSAAKLSSVLERPRGTTKLEWATWVQFARMLFNLDEAITKN